MRFEREQDQIILVSSVLTPFLSQMFIDVLSDALSYGLVELQMPSCPSRPHFFEYTNVEKNRLLGPNPSSQKSCHSHRLPNLYK